MYYSIVGAQVHINLPRPSWTNLYAGIYTSFMGEDQNLHSWLDA